MFVGRLSEPAYLFFAVCCRNSLTGKEASAESAQVEGIEVGTWFARDQVGDGERVHRAQREADVLVREAVEEIGLLRDTPDRR